MAEHEHKFTVGYLREKTDHKWLSDNGVSFTGREPMQIKVLRCKCGEMTAVDLLPIENKPLHKHK